MATTNRQTEQEIVRRGLERGLSQDQIRQAVEAYRNQTSTGVATIETKEEPKKGFLQEAAEDVREGVSSIGSSFKKRSQDVKESFGRIIDKGEGIEQNPLETSLQTVGTGIGFLGDILGTGIATAAKVIAPEEVERAVVDKARNVLATPQGQAAVTALSEGMESYEAWKQKNPRGAENIESVLEIGSIIPITSAASRGAKAGLKGLESGAEAVATGVRAGAGKAADTVSDFGRAAAQTAGDIIPKKPQIINQQVTQALDLTPGDTANILNATGNDVGEFVARFNLIGENKDSTIESINNFFKQNHDEVRDNVSQVDKIYSIADIPRYEDALITIKEQTGGVRGLEADNAIIDSLLQKEAFTLDDVQRTKELIDDHFSLYRTTGDPKIGATKEGIRNIRKDLREFIENEVEEVTGADIRGLNNNVATAKGITEFASKRSTRGFTRANVTLKDIGTFGVGSVVGFGNPLIGVAAVLGRKILSSPTVKLRFAKWLDGLSDAKKIEVRRDLQSGRIPEDIPKNILEDLEVPVDLEDGLSGLTKESL